MFGRLCGQLDSYGLRETAAQGWEKLTRRWRRIGHGAPWSGKPAYSGQPEQAGAGVQRVLIAVHRFYPDSAGGTERCALTLAQALKKNGRAVLICAYSERRRGQYQGQAGGVLWSKEQYQGLPVIRFRLKRAPYGFLKDIPTNGAPFDDFFQMVLEGFRPELVHFAHLSRVSGLVWCCRERCIPYVVTLTDFYAFCHFSTMIDRKGAFCGSGPNSRQCGSRCPCSRIRDAAERRRAAREILFGATAVAVPSNYAAETVLAEMPGLRLRVRVIPHGIPENGLNPPERIGMVRNFAYVGPLSQEKGAAFLIRAFQKLPGLCTLRIYGSGPSFFLRRLAGRDKRILFCGALPPQQMDEVYLRTDCVIVPSLVPETYGLVLREAEQSGCLVLASRIGALPEAVREGRNGFLFTPGDEEDLLRALQKAVQFDLAKLQKTELAAPEEEMRSYLALYSQ